MSDSLTMTADEVPDPSPAPSGPAGVLAAVRLDPACLDPEGSYPPDVSALSLVELHVWHSRISGQLYRDLADPAGPHPVTRDRHQELVAELDARGNWLVLPGAVT